MRKHSHISLRELLSSTNVVEDRSDKGLDGRLIVYTNSNSRVTEEYRMLQTHLQALRSEKKFKSIMITSSVEGEGKTVTCCNLAALLSTDINKRVIIVDCDMRKPRIHKMLNMQQSPGVSDILNGKCELSECIKTPAVENLFVIPCGEMVLHPSEMLRNPSTKVFFDALTASFDYVIVDSPPTLPVSDSRIMAALTDVVIMVVRFDKTPKKSIKDTFSLLKIAHAQPVGCILTDFRAPLYYRAQYSYYY